MTESNRVTTGVEGLDRILRGGLVRHRTYLVEGSPGTGKTTLALQFLQAGAEQGVKAIYITLAETESEVRAVARSHGWLPGAFEKLIIQELPSGFDPKKVGEMYTLFRPSEVELANVTEAIARAVETAGAELVVVDSLSELRLIAQDTLRYRRQMLSLKNYFARTGVTVLLLDDVADVMDNLLTVSHGVIRLHRLSPEFGGHRRRLEVVKMREIDFLGGFHDYAIRKGGLEVFPRLVPSDSMRHWKQQLVSSGVPKLDALLNGGVHEGTATVVIGPAGCGKTTLTTQYALAAAERGERAGIFIFDEGLQTFFTRAEGLGMPIYEHYKKGTIVVKQVDPAEISPGEFSHQVSQLPAQGVKVIVIDSLTGYLHAMPNEHYLMLQMHELLTFLNQSGVVTMLVVAQQGLNEMRMENPIDLSYLVDTILSLQYFQEDGVIGRSIAVSKKRPGAHSLSAHRYVLGPDRLAVAEVLKHLRRAPNFVYPAGS